MSDPNYTLVEYVAANRFAVSNAAKDSFVSEFADGLRLRADCQADGIRLGSVAGAIHDAETGRTLVDVDLDSGSVLTANLAWVLHGNAVPDSLCHHGHTGPADGGDLPGVMLTNNSRAFSDGYIHAEGSYTGFMFTQLGAPLDAKKSIYHVADSRVALLLTDDAETVFHEAWSVGRTGATPTDMTIAPLLIANGGVNTGKINGQDVTSGIITQAIAPACGQCRLTLSGSVLLLSPHNGNILTIDNVQRTVPSGGISLASPGVANTLYYIYARWAGSTMSLEASTTASSIDSRNGVMTKSGDTMPTLVGMAQTNASGQWENSSYRRLVCSYYNPKTATATCPSMASDLVTSSTTAISTGKYVDYVTFTGVSTMLAAAYFNNSSITSCRYDVKIGSSTLSSFLLVNYAANQQTLFTQVSIVPPSGYVKIDAYFYVGSGTGTLYNYSGFQMIINQ